IVLNDADRKRRAARNQRELDERNTPESRQAAAERRARAQAEQREREERNADKNRRRAEEEAERSAHPRVPKAPREGLVDPQGRSRAPGVADSNAIAPAEVARNRAIHEARLKEAADHKAAVQARAAKRAKPPASGLPVPQ
ncbi:MAG TPA: hypothetical protein VLK85_27350, partial [Ramlibacter sp.]|nr:hypothetical protein [Ramlibacter sp.]